MAKVTDLGTPPELVITPAIEAPALEQKHQIGAVPLAVGKRPKMADATPLRAVIRKRLLAGERLGRSGNVRWKAFQKSVCDDCNVAIDAPGFKMGHIRKIVNEELAKLPK